MRFLAAIGALAIIAAIGAAVFFFGGFFKVAASEPDLPPVAWALKKVRTASINRFRRRHNGRRKRAGTGLCAASRIEGRQGRRQ